MGHPKTPKPQNPKTPGFYLNDMFVFRLRGVNSLFLSVMYKYQNRSRSFLLLLMLLQDDVEVSALLVDSDAKDYRPDPSEEKGSRVELNHSIHDSTAIAL